MSKKYTGNTNGTAEKIGGTVYSSQALYDNVGADAACIVAKRVEAVMLSLYSDHPYTVVVIDQRSDCPDLSTEETGCVDNKAYDEFRSYIYNGAPVVKDDFNICLTNRADSEPNDTRPLGCGSVGGNIAVAERGPDIAGVVSKDYYEITPGGDSVMTAIHEIGHNLGMQHDVGDRNLFDPDRDGTDEEVITPFQPGRGNENVCGNKAADSNKDVLLEPEYD
ncbi:MAG: zinc-dependent metalloprotease family protein, partial [Halobaculum sp.]